MNAKVVLYDRRGADGAFWLVDATIDATRLTVCSGDSHNEWFLHVEWSHGRRLLDALRDRCGEHKETSDQIHSETLRLLAKAFSGRSGILDEIRVFLDRSGIPHTTDVWMGK